MTEVISDRAAINRENSLKSTGPITEAGKKVSSLNALRHGLTGQTVVMPSEDLAEYLRFTRELQDDFKPVGALEFQLSQSLADDAWRLNRAKAIENNLLTMSLNHHIEPIEGEHPEIRDALAVADALREQTKALATLSMHQNRIARAFDRTLAQLRQIQAERRERERVELAEASRAYQNYVRQSKTPFDPAEYGFVLPIAEIEQHAKRDRLVRNGWLAPAPSSTAAKMTNLK
jgi:hypothetical protein